MVASANAVRAALKSQYHAALAMLGDALRRCPASLWTELAPRNAFWQVAYHTLFFAHFYIQRDHASFRPWEGHVADVQHPDGIAGPADPRSALPLLPPPYPREKVLAYWRFCVDLVDPAVDAMDVFAPESGFPWYPIPKLDHQIVNIRHIQHGAAQLADRLRAAEDVGVAWIGAGRGVGSG